VIIRCKGSRVEVHDAPLEVDRALCSRLSLPNPRYDGAVKAGKVPIGIPRMVQFFKVAPDGTLVLPGACGGMAVQAAKLAGEQYSVEVEVRELPPHGLRFAGELRLYQVAAVADLLRYDHGVIAAPTGSGKTVIGCYLIAERRQPTLVIVHSKLLQAQWADACNRFLGGKMAGDVGTIGGSNWGEGRVVTIGIVNTVAKRAQELSNRYGHVIVDECHRVVADSYQDALRNLRARYRTGLSATPWRRDGLDDVIKFSLGRLVEVQRGPLVDAGAILPIQVVQVPTEFSTDRDASGDYVQVIGELVNDRARNELIADRAIQARGRGEVVLVLSDRVDHCETLARMAGGAPLHGQLKAHQRARADGALQLAREGRAVVLCATTQLVGEGFDIAAAHTLVVATPIKFDGRLIQVLGRVLRPAPGQTYGQIVDFCDWNVGVLANGARARARVYRNIKREERGS
jgi:superfamily II DNA or RNA helicase